MNELIGMLGGTAVALVAVGWLVRSLIAHYLSKDIESYKESLKAQNTLEIEQLKSELTIAAQTQHVKFSRLHEKQGDFIEELYKDVNRLDQLSKLMIGNFAQDISLEEKIGGAVKISEEYLEINSRFFKRRLYFSEEICSLFYSYKQTAFEPAMKLLSDISRSEKENFINEYLDDFDNKIKMFEKLYSAIENEFRLLLGVIR